MKFLIREIRYSVRLFFTPVSAIWAAARSAVTNGHQPPQGE